MKTRNLKISYGSRQIGKPTARQTKFYPQLILQGNWMKEAGFEIGNLTEVKVSGGKIEIHITTEERKEQQYKAAYYDFLTQLDSIFFEGYGGRLAEEKPAQFNNELNQFINNHHYENI